VQAKLAVGDLFAASPSLRTITIVQRSFRNEVSNILCRARVACMFCVCMSECMSVCMSVCVCMCARANL